MAEPSVSVVVSSYNRPVQLARLLASLREQTCEESEVVVVDNGSSGSDTAEVLRGEAKRFAASGVSLQTIRHERTLGPAGGRNAGWRAARAPLVAFTDDDCVADPSWLAACVEAFGAQAGRRFAQGRTVPEGVAGWLSHTVAIDRLGPQYETCNIVYPRAVLEALGGFDERYGLRPAGEDTDLAWRAIASGVTPVFAADAVVIHAVERIGIRGLLRIAARWGPAARIFAEHPAARSEILWGGVFWNVWHYLLWRSLLAAAAPPWLRRLLWRRWARALRRRAAALGAPSWAIPVLVAVDAVECWTIARGAIRARVLVL